MEITCHHDPNSSFQILSLLTRESVFWSITDVHVNRTIVYHLKPISIFRAMNCLRFWGTFVQNFARRPFVVGLRLGHHRFTDARSLRVLKASQPSSVVVGFESCPSHTPILRFRRLVIRSQYFPAFQTFSPCVCSLYTHFVHHISYTRGQESRTS